MNRINLYRKYHGIYYNIKKTDSISYIYEGDEGRENHLSLH